MDITHRDVLNDVAISLPPVRDVNDVPGLYRLLPPTFGSS